MPTAVAVTVAEVRVPKTATRDPTLTSASVADVIPDARYVVDEPTSTVTVVPSPVVSVKELAPTVATVPMAAGGDPEGPPGPPIPHGPLPFPMATFVAVTVFEESLPKTATCDPTLTSVSEGEVTPWST
jgi:hypothetical protein